MDGTLLDPEGRLSAPTAAILRQLAEGGLRIVLASGRMTARVLPFAESLRLPLDLITYNGAVTLAGGPAAWSAIAVRGIGAEAREAIFSLCRDQGVFLNVYANGRLYGYHSAGDFTWSAHYEKHSGATYTLKSARLEDLPVAGLEKLLVMSHPELRDRLFTEWQSPLSVHCDLTKSNPEYLEFVGKGVSKGAALSTWLEQNRILPAELLAFGDAENDLEMLSLAGLGYAMSNATPGLRANYSRFTRWSHGEDGVAKELCSLYGLPFPVPT